MYFTEAVVAGWSPILQRLHSKIDSSINARRAAIDGEWEEIETAKSSMNKKKRKQKKENSDGLYLLDAAGGSYVGRIGLCIPKTTHTETFFRKNPPLIDDQELDSSGAGGIGMFFGASFALSYSCTKKSPQIFFRGSYL